MRLEPDLLLVCACLVTPSELIGFFWWALIIIPPLPQQGEQRRGNICFGDPAGRFRETLRLQAVYTRQRPDTQQQWVTLTHTHIDVQQWPIKTANESKNIIVTCLSVNSDYPEQIKQTNRRARAHKMIMLTRGTMAFCGICGCLNAQFII